MDFSLEFHLRGHVRSRIPGQKRQIPENRVKLNLSHPYRWLSHHQKEWMSQFYSNFYFEKNLEKKIIIRNYIHV